MREIVMRVHRAPGEATYRVVGAVIDEGHTLYRAVRRLRVPADELVIFMQDEVTTLLDALIDELVRWHGPSSDHVVQPELPF